MELAKWLIGVLFNILSYFGIARLKVFKPKQYCVINGNLRIRFVFHADGPKPIIIREIRLSPINPMYKIPFKFITDDFFSFRRNIELPIIIKPNDISALILCFNEDYQIIQAEHYSKKDNYVLEAKLGDSNRWKRLTKFQLNECEKIEPEPIFLINNPFD